MPLAFLGLLITGSFAAPDHAGPRSAAGAPPDQAIVEPPPARYAPRGIGDDLVDYDLAGDAAESDRKRAAGQQHHFAGSFLKQFMDAYHPGVEFTWQRSAKRGSGFVGTRKPDELTLQTVYVGWQIYNDGCNWNFGETELTRHMGFDPFEIVPDADARSRIKAALGPEVVDRPCDVFRQRKREVMTGTESATLSFGPADLSAPQYGVFVEGRVRFFNAAGDPL